MQPCSYTGARRSRNDGHEACPYSLVAICIFILPAQAQYSGGSGAADDPYQIATAEDLILLGETPDDYDKHFKLMADIDLSEFDGKDGRPEFNIIGIADDMAFTGVFDGNGHTISHFRHTSTDTDYTGLFGYINGGTVQVKDLGLIDPEVDAGTGSWVGSLHVPACVLAKCKNRQIGVHGTPYRLRGWGSVDRRGAA